MVKALLDWFRPARPIPRLPADEVERLYPRYRWQIFESAFLGYAMFYVVRNNLAVVAKEMAAELQYDKSMVGDILAATAMAYGIGKLLMGYLADCSNPRKFIAVGLLLSASVNFVFGASHNYGMHLFLWTMNGLIQGMGYGPCARGLGHWYTCQERGRIFGVWNMSHNVGGGAVGIVAAWCAHHYGWPSAFYVPGLIATLGAFYLFWRMRDTPPSVGLPPVEEYRNEYPPEEEVHDENNLRFREILVRYILNNKALWLIAITNFFVYIARYSMLDWGPTYLKEKKGASILEGGFSTLLIEFAGAAGMLIMGWVSDRFDGRRGMVSAVCMFPLVLAFAGILFTPPGFLWLDLTLLAVIGFLVYVPVMMLGVMSLDLILLKNPLTTF
ncbi:MAG: MFS transporter [Verrucomicrobiota bacterium]